MSSSEGLVFELGIEFSKANNVLLMSLLEETHEEEECYGDDRLVNMIQSLEAEINGTEMDQMYEMGHLADQDCSLSANNSPNHWIDMELISSLPFDEMNAWIPCGDEMMEHVAMEYDNGMDDFQLCYGVFLEQQYKEANYLAKGKVTKYSGFN